MNKISPHKLCGARIWVNWSIEGPLRMKTYEYWGMAVNAGEYVYTFVPYGRKGPVEWFTEKQLDSFIGFFRPLVYTTEELNELTPIT